MFSDLLYWSVFELRPRFSGELLDDNEHWQIYCTVETESECFNMATFRRKGMLFHRH